MSPEELETLEEELTAEVRKRRGLGEYSMEAGGLRLLSESVLKIVQHLREKMDEARDRTPPATRRKVR